jgi:diaminopimelate epimerase
VIELRWQPDGRVTVDMGAPVFDWPRMPFDPAGLATPVGWFMAKMASGRCCRCACSCFVAVVSMGNPHAVLLVDDVDTAPVAALGPLIEATRAFPRGVNAGFLQVVDRSHVRLRVYERGAGETLACGTGACAAVVAGIRLGLLDRAWTCTPAAACSPSPGRAAARRYA